LIGLIFLILIVFSIVWVLVWFWFFKPNETPGENFYKLADKAFESGDYKTAKELLLQIANINSNPDAKYKLGISFLKLKEYDDAKGCFEQLLKKSPKNLDFLSNLAQVFQLQKKYDEALDIYNKITSQTPKSEDGPVNIARVYYEKGDFSNALQALEKAKENSPDSSQILFSIIKCKSKMCNMDNDDECKQILDEYIKIANRNDLPAEFYTTIAKTYAMNGETDKTLEYCQRAISLNSEDIEAYQLLGLIQLIKDDIEGAKSNLTMALSFQPNNKESHNIFSYVLCQEVTSCSVAKCRENYYKLIKKHLK